MAVIDKFEVRARISPEAKGATERISKLLDRSQSNLLERLILTWEALWLQQMTAAERTKYLPAVHFADQVHFAELIEPVARRLLGEPNARFSNAREFRFGTHGSMSIDLKKRTWFDHENSIGGGVIALIHHKLGKSTDASAWLREEGFLSPKKTAVDPKPRLVRAYNSACRQLTSPRPRLLMRQRRTEALPPEQLQRQRGSERPKGRRKSRLRQRRLEATAPRTTEARGL